MSLANDLAILIRHMSYNSGTNQLESTVVVESAGKERGSSTTTATTQIALHTFAHASYASARYLIAMSRGSEYHSLEIHLINDGSSVDMTQYGEIKSATLATFDADISGSDCRLLCTPDSATSTAIKFDVTLVDA